MRYCPTCGASYEDQTMYCPHDGQATQLGSDDPDTVVTDPLIGTVIDGRYRIEAHLGEGGMGVVYRAVHTVLGKPLAVKVLRGNMAKDTHVVERFMQEARAATEIRDPNIIDISDFGRLPDGSVYFVMEYLEGTSLSGFISRGGSVPVADALHIIRQIASALGSAHERGIIHRDLKPDNIMLVARGEDKLFVKVLDFGIAKVGNAATRLTQTGMVFGTPHYMSPEQAAGQSVDHRTDIYALGVIMYEVFTGKVPFDADTFMGILTKHMFEPPVPPSSKSGSAAMGAVEDVIMKALSKKPEQRYQSMAELSTDLSSVAAGGRVDIGRRPGIAPPNNLADALEPPSRTEYGIARGSGSGAPIPQNRTPLIIAGFVGVILLLGGVGGAVYAISSSDADPPPETVLATATTAANRATVDAEVVPEPAEPTTAVAVVTMPASADPAVIRQTIELASDPEGAEIVVNGAVIGNTPARLPRPTGENALDVELRMRGRETESVRLSAESEETIRVTLAALTSRPRGGRPPTKAGRDNPAATKRPPPERGGGFNTEVVDPWAD